jgi:hypothetical protein
VHKNAKTRTFVTVVVAFLDEVTVKGAKVILRVLRAGVGGEPCLAVERVALAQEERTNRGLVANAGEASVLQSQYVDATIDDGLRNNVAPSVQRAVAVEAANSKAVEACIELSHLP